MSSMLFTLAITLSALRAVSFSLGLGQIDLSTNCSADATPCGGPIPVCCPSGLRCNFNRGIPVCENPNDPFLSGFADHQPCADPYLSSCDLIGILGFCCPIGTICFNDGEDQAISCVDAYGTTASSFPSATTGIVPSATPVPASDNRILYTTPGAWNISHGANCTASDLIYATETLNATVSFNYSGPSIEVYVVNAPNGGVFSVVVDGFNTSSTIDTFAGTADDGISLCSPYQFPPFAITPPQFSSQQNHTITLVFVGPSENVPTNISTIIGQFNSFAIPDFAALTASPTGSHATSNSMGIYRIVFISSLVALSSFVIGSSV